MTTLAVMVFLITAYSAVSIYVRRASQYLEASSAPWERLYEAAKEIIADETMPQPAAAFAAAAVVCAGCGCMTRQTLFDAIRGRLWERSAPVSDPPMSAEQKALFSTVVWNALYYDSLRAPVSGFLLRRLVMPWLQDFSEKAPPKPKVAVSEILASSKHAISHRAEGKKILAMAALG